MIAHLSRMSNRNLLALTLSLDVVVFVGGGYLERISLQAAADPASTAAFIIGLLAANFALFGLVVLGFTANGLLLARVANRFFRRPRYAQVERGEIETSHQSASR